MDPKQNKAWSEIFGHLVTDLQQLAMSELNLMQTELRRAAEITQRRSKYAIIFAAVALTGILPLIASMVILLGHTLGDRFALSSLIVGALCIGIGGSLSVWFSQRISARDFSLPVTRETLQKGALRLVQKQMSPPPFTKSDMKEEKRAS